MTAPHVADAVRIYLVECYAPGGYRSETESTLRRACVVAAEQRGDGAIEYVGAVFVLSDDLVFYALRARDIATVRHIASSSGLIAERIVESTVVGMEWTPTATALADPG